ncbi:hypothetical protein T4A_12978 [Trichinella pseudospiralis]|uniref:Uncharacterized protein n=1 Tax=Trichinella pseudospiralis TaxID=6337 RepID=A0A0V1C3H4_TRIPS|nr:hypothetical protein T4A_12978 [Trichinella pseudospiralis]
MVRNQRLSSQNVRMVALRRKWSYIVVDPGARRHSPGQTSSTGYVGMMVRQTKYFHFS